MQALFKTTLVPYHFFLNEKHSGSESTLISRSFYK